MTLQFSWTELWSYHDALADPDLKVHLQEEVIGDGWLYRQSAKAQEQVLKDAPREFVEKVMGELKPEAIDFVIKMGFNPYLRR